MPNADSDVEPFGEPLLTVDRHGFVAFVRARDGERHALERKDVALLACAARNKTVRGDGPAPATHRLRRLVAIDLLRSIQHGHENRVRTACEDPAPAGDSCEARISLGQDLYARVAQGRPHLWAWTAKRRGARIMSWAAFCAFADAAHAFNVRGRGNDVRARVGRNVLEELIQLELARPA